MEYILAPSILAADFKNLGEQMKLTEDNGAKYIHFDVMDGMFVPSISFGMPVLKSIHDVTGHLPGNTGRSNRTSSSESGYVTGNERASGIRRSEVHSGIAG